MKIKKRYTSEEKATILREYLEDHVPISDLAEKYGIHPNAIYLWKKKMFESAPGNFSDDSKRQKKKISQMEARIRYLEETLAKRDSVIAELAADNIELKKNIPGEDLTKNGSNLKLGKKLPYLYKS